MKLAPWNHTVASSKGGERRVWRFQHVSESAKDNTHVSAIKTTNRVSRVNFERKRHVGCTPNRFLSAGNHRSLWSSERLARIREANPSRSVRDRRRRGCRRLLLLLLLLREVVIVVVVVLAVIVVV